MNTALPNSIDSLKIQAKHLRAELTKVGKAISHSKSLELLAKQHGYKDWNTLYAAARRRSDKLNLTLGQRVSGTYLGQPFEGKILGMQSQERTQTTRIKLRFDNPVDVVSFASFSSKRQQVSCTIKQDGTSPEKTSNGQPHLVLNMPHLALKMKGGAA